MRKIVFMDIVPSHDVALWLIDVIDVFLGWIGLGSNALIEEFLYVVLIIVASLAIGWLLRVLVLFIVKRVIVLRRFEIGKELVAQKVFTRLSYIIPPLIFLAFIPFAFAQNESIILNLLNGTIVIYLSITIGIAICAILSFLWNHYDSHKNEKNHPLRGVLDVAKGVVWIVIMIVTVSSLLGKSPTVLLTGLGAFAAALMLVFKDSILGFVAGVQLSQNDMLRVGDWIIVPSTIANGIVEDVSLTVVKVRNWDNTLVMLPPYTLVSTSFQNWRGMIESKVRMISRIIIVDNNSVRYCDERYLSIIKVRFPQLTHVIESGIKYEEGFVGIYGTRETNLGLFRAYLCDYLMNHDLVSKEWQILVNLQDGTSDGIPLQISCYAKTTNWNKYEAIQSEIMEHAISLAPLFELSIYNSIAGNDLQRN